jgi:hypothetical protein
MSARGMTRNGKALAFIWGNGQDTEPDPQWRVRYYRSLFCL